MPSLPSRSPSDVLAEEIRRLGLSQKQFAEKLNVTPQYLSMLVNGHRPFNRSICQQLSKITKYSEEDWMGMMDAQSKQEREAEHLAAGGCLDDEGIRQAIQSGKLEVQPYDQDAVSSASLLLRPATHLRIHHADGRITEHRLDSGVKLMPGEIATFDSLELLAIKDLASLLEPVADLALEFIQLIPCPPGIPHQGAVRLVLKNAGFEPYEVNDLPVARLRFLPVGSTRG